MFASNLLTANILYIVQLFIQGEWGTSQSSEEDERRRKAQFKREVIPSNRAQLKVLAKSYQVRHISCRPGEDGGMLRSES